MSDPAPIEPKPRPQIGLVAGNRGTTAADLGSQPSTGELVQALLELAVERKLDVDLPDDALDGPQARAVERRLDGRNLPLPR